MKLDLSQVPNNPGIYLWKNEFGHILYVGKAKNLKSRMKQYFKGMLNSYKTSKLVKQITDFEYIITSSEKEALVLERNLIEKYNPEFNIKLTDDKRYPYIHVYLDKKLNIKLLYRVRSFNKKQSLIFGPFPNGYGAKKMVNMLNRLTTYKNGLPIKNLSYKEWEEKYIFIKKLLSNGIKSLVKELEIKMNNAAKNLQFEMAQEIKETIKAFEFYKENQSVEIKENKNIDVWGVVEKGGYLSIALLFYRNGFLLSQKQEIVEITSDVESSLRQFASQYYNNNFMPDMIYSNMSFETTINLITPYKGNYKKIVNIALENARDNIDIKFRDFKRKKELTIGALKELQKLLDIKNINHILMIDNSATNNTNPISAIVSYRNGKKQFSEYRKYNIKVSDRAADVDYMKQGVIKYFKDNPFPDLFIVDGGKAQVNEIKKIMPNLTIIGLVKNDKHITRSIIDLDGNEIQIKSKNLLLFLRGIQKEVDRYAKKNHTKKRLTTLEGSLKTIEGIGPKTEEKLLLKFKTYSAIYNASVEELKQIVSEEMAIKILERLHND